MLGHYVRQRARGGGRGAIQETLRATGMGRAHLHICLETWKRGRDGGRIAAADAVIIVGVEDEAGKDRKQRESEGAMPMYDITGIVLSVLPQMKTVCKCWRLAKETLTGLHATKSVCFCQEDRVVSKKDSDNVFIPRADMKEKLWQEHAQEKKKKVITLFVKVGV